MIKRAVIMTSLLMLSSVAAHAEPPSAAPSAADKAARFEKHKASLIAIQETELACFRRATNPNDIKQCHDQTKRARMETRLNNISTQKQNLEQREQKLKGALEKKPANTP
ncbi:MAG: hypothetical protein HQL58_02215 [Magnetococcales bacterium]|nr:hypothetical protein [Magnetococcales bacterium]